MNLHDVNIKTITFHSQACFVKSCKNLNYFTQFICVELSLIFLIYRGEYY